MGERRIVTHLTEADRGRLIVAMAELAHRALDVGRSLAVGDDTRAYVASLFLGQSAGAVDELAAALRGSQVIEIPDDAAEVLDA